VRQRRCQSAYDREAHDHDCEEGEQRGPDEGVVEEKVARRVARRCVRFISEEMRQSRCGLENRMVVLEYLFDDPLVYPHLPDYYFRPREAKIYAQVVNNVKKELSDVKGVQSAEKLAYRGALLNCVVGDNIGQGMVSGYSRVLSTNQRNLRRAAERRSTAISKGASMWRLPTRKHRPGLSSTTVESIVNWWNGETHVSPKKIKNVNHRIGRNEKEQHPTHYLCETQVRYIPLTVLFSEECRFRILVICVNDIVNHSIGWNTS
jgi:hypothetical protein